MGCNYLQPVFCRFLCLDGIKHGVLPPCHLCAALVPRWHQARSIAAVPPLRRSGASMASGTEYCRRATFAPL